MRLARHTLAAAAAAAALALLPAVAVAATTTDSVYPSRLGVDWHTADTRAGASVSFETTYGGALGAGAVVLDTEDSSAQKAQLFTDAWDGTRLADITALSYSTYQVAPAGSPALPAINIRADLDADGDVDAYLVYEPYADLGNAAVVAGQWQSWDALRGGQAEWWSGQIPECSQATQCTWGRVLELFPAAVVLEDPTSLRSPTATEVPELFGSIGFNQGSGNAGVVAAADALRIATADRDVTYNFEAAVTLAGTTQCKSGGWATSTDPVFRNQGDCVSYFASAGKTHP